MKKEKIALLVLGVGSVLALSPKVVNAYDEERQGNLIYHYSGDELKKITFAGEQIISNPGGDSDEWYTPRDTYGANTNLSKKIYIDKYGQKFIAYVPDGYSLASLVEHTGKVDIDTRCVMNSTAQKDNHFKTYYQRYATGGNYPNGSNSCNMANYNKGGSMTYDGQSGEWRYYGYNSYGRAVVGNPTFPDDYPVKTYPNEYPWKENWGVNQEDPFDYSAYNSAKLSAIQSSKSIYGLTGSDSLWMSRLSLQTDPYLDTPVFLGKHSNGKFYRQTHAQTSTTLTRDLSVTKFEVLYNNEVIGVFTRDSSGNVKYDVKQNLASENTYTYRITVKNSNEADMDSSQLKIQFGNAIGANANLSDSNNWFANNLNKYNLSSAKLKKNESVTISRGPFKIRNLTTSTAYRATGVIDKSHFTRKVPDSNDKSNDWSALFFNIDNGNISAVNTQLIDEQGNVVNHAPIPGVRYKIRYNYKYTGPDRNSNFKLKITNTVVRTLNNGTTDTFKETVYKTLYSPSNGTTFYVETPYMMFETAKAQASSKLTQNPLIDSNANDNSTSANYSDYYDITVQNVRIYPKTEMPTTFPATIKVGIKYDVVVTAPSYVPYFELDVVSQINSNVSFVDHVKKGTTKDITREIEITVNGTGSLPATVHVNKPSNTNQRIWESDYSNNQGSTTGTVNSDGSNGNLVIKAPENPNNGGCTLSGVNNNVDFSKTHDMDIYYGYYKGTSLYNGKSYSLSSGGFYKYSNSGVYSYKGDYNESYKIEQILFKSKLTTDLGLGNDGWVDLKSSVGQIKAGYGYDLKVIVNYKTNAITTQPNIVQTPSNPLANHGKNPSSVSSVSQGKFATNLNVMANIPKDIYVKTADGKVLSASGIYGTTKAFTSRELSNDDTGVKVEYTLINDGKIYIDESTQDGKYNLSVFTPNVSGISGKNLCDKNSVQIEVKGSMLDDNNDQIVQ